MLSKPEAGWSDFSLGKKQYGLSYLTNIPILWLNRAIHGLETLEPFEVYGELEPGRMVCLVSHWHCQIMIESEGPRGFIREEGTKEIVDVDMLHFCTMLYEDMLKHINEWSCWDCENKDHEIVKRALHVKLKRLSELITERSDCFERCNKS